MDLSDLASAEREARALDLAAEEAVRVFDLARGPLLRTRLVRLADDDHVLIFNMHHIVSDGWSIGILVEEIAHLYRAFVAGEAPALPELPVQYADFAYWQRGWLEDETLDRQLAYWREQLHGLPEALALPTDRPRPAVSTYRGALHQLVVSETITEGLHAVSRRAGATLFMTLLSAFDVLLFRYTGETDFTVGSPIANRNRAKLERLIGFFVNSLVLRADLSRNPTFMELLLRTREVTLGAYAHQDLPFERLVDELQPVRDMSHSPLFQVMFALQNMRLGELTLPRLKVQPLALEARTAKFDLTLSMREEDGRLWGALEYSVDLFDHATAARMMRHFETLLESIAANPDRRLSDLPILTGAERSQLLGGWNATTTEDSPGGCVHALFEAQVERTPEAPAVVYEEGGLTYAELDGRANQLGRRLRELGVGPDVVVGVLMERSVALVVSVLGVLKAGGAYLPMDPSYPSERLAYMVDDAGAPVVVSQLALSQVASVGDARVVYVDGEGEGVGGQGRERLSMVTEPRNLAYVIYTSGSTGHPKGVMVTHEAVCNHMQWMQSTYPLTELDRVLQKTPFSFDASVWEFLAPLLSGAQLVLARPGGHLDTRYLERLLSEGEVTTLQVVPSLLRVLVEEGVIERARSLRRLFCGGEELPAELRERVLESYEGELCNLYGPTETTIEVTSWRCERGSGPGRTPLGRPIANTQVYLLDAELSPVPVGVPGELHVAGVALARGYLGRAGLTAQQFIPNPFSDTPGRRLYRTGDLGRYLPDGTIEYLGRLDHQVKVRGHRIELGEVESELLRHPAVREAVALARPDPHAGTRLEAHVVVHPGADLDLDTLREFLRARLPEYMLPTAFATLPQLPLTASGKIDRAALSAPERRHRSARDHVAPRTEKEQALARIWAELLRFDAVGVNDNFFALGGDSILSIQIVARAREVGIELTPRQLFEHQTIAELATAAGSAPAPHAEQGVVTGDLP